MSSPDIELPDNYGTLDNMEQEVIRAVEQEIDMSQFGLDGEREKNSLKQSIWAHIKNNIFFGRILIALNILCLVHMFAGLVRAVYYQNADYTQFGVAMFLVMVLLPIGTFILLSFYEHWNYENRKKLQINIILMSFVFLIADIVELVYYWTICPLFFAIPIGNDVTVEMIMGLAHWTNSIIILVFSGIAFFRLKSVIYAPDILTNLINFRLNIAIDLRKDKSFKYDARFVRLKKNGVEFGIRMTDRFLHMFICGTTGTGKTSSIFTVGICNDLDVRVHNDEYAKKEIMKHANELYLIKEFDQREFLIDNFVGKTEEAQKFLNELKNKAMPCGLTCVCPNEGFADTVYQLASNRGFKVNRVDPTYDENGNLKPGFIGFNPLYISPNLHERARQLEIIKKAKMVADVFQSLDELFGKGDPYFTRINRCWTTNFSILLMMTFEEVNGKGAQPTLIDLQDMLNDFNNVKVYYDALIKMYARPEQIGPDGTVSPIDAITVNCGSFNYIAVQIRNDIFDQKKRSILEERINGMRNNINDFMSNQQIRDIYTCRDTIDMDKMLSEAQITVVNYALELGKSDATAFGLFFALSFNNAILRRPGTEKTRIPHFYRIDEFPILMHSSFEEAFSLYRQYRVSTEVAFQNFSQFNRNDQTKKLKSVVQNNARNQIFFGGGGLEEMEYIQALGGTELDYIEQVTESADALSLENTHKSFSKRWTPQEKNVISSTDARYLQMQECTFISVIEGTIQRPVKCKSSYLVSKRYTYKPKRRLIDFSKFEVLPGDRVEGTDTVDEKSMEKADNIIPMPVPVEPAAEFSISVEKDKEQSGINNMLHFKKNDVTISDQSNREKVGLDISVLSSTAEEQIMSNLELEPTEVIEENDGVEMMEDDDDLFNLDAYDFSEEDDGYSVLPKVSGGDILDE